MQWHGADGQNTFKGNIRRSLKYFSQFLVHTKEVQHAKLCMPVLLAAINIIKKTAQSHVSNKVNTSKSRSARIRSGTVGALLRRSKSSEIFGELDEDGDSGSSSCGLSPPANHDNICWQTAPKAAKKEARENITRLAGGVTNPKLQLRWTRVRAARNRMWHDRLAFFG